MSLKDKIIIEKDLSRISIQERDAPVVGKFIIASVDDIEVMAIMWEKEKLQVCWKSHTFDNLKDIRLHAIAISQALDLAEERREQQQAKIQGTEPPMQLIPVGDSLADYARREAEKELTERTHGKKERNVKE